MLAIDRDDPFSDFSRRLGEQLLEPRAEIGDSGRGNQRDFIPARIRRRAKNDSEHGARIFFNRNAQALKPAPFRPHASGISSCRVP